jgi:sugar lactone lactonase YvrE
MVRVRSVLFIGLASVTLVLAGCPSPFLARIKDVIAKAPFTGKSYTFLRQWGNPHPEWSFNSAVVKTDTAGFVYVADSSFRIRQFDAAGALKKTVSGVSTQGTNARLYDMAFDAAGDMYVTTNDTSEVQKYDVSGNLLKSWGTATDLYGGIPLGQVQGIALDSSGNVYVVDRDNHRVVKFDVCRVWSGGHHHEQSNGDCHRPDRGLRRRFVQ